MSRIAKRFVALRDQDRRALIPFLTAGDPHPDRTVEILHALVAAGADLIELGVPFSDPMADGPVIQRASERALDAGTTLAGVLDMVAAFRASDADTPIVLMGYLNPFEAMGYESFAARAAEAGVDGVLTVDLPAEESEEFVDALVAHGLDPVFLVAPTTSDVRIGRIGALGRGYVYYVSFKGVTGASRLDVDAVATRMAVMRAHLALPIVVGFGIKDAASAAEVAALADGVVVGSALVSRVAALGDSPRLAAEVGDFLRPLRAAMDATTVRGSVG